jgi:hypothetical protein
MSIANVVPVYLDNTSGWKPNQVNEINKIARNLRTAFESKAIQHTKDKPQIEKFTISKYNRVLNLNDYRYNDTFSINFILDPAGFEVNGEYPLLELSSYPSSFNYEGSNDDEAPYKLLSSLGTISIKKINSSPYFIIKVKDTWPTDEQHNKLKYSCYIGGRI